MRPSVGNRDIAATLSYDGDEFGFEVALLADEFDLPVRAIERTRKLGEYERFFWQTVVHFGGVGLVVDADSKNLSRSRRWTVEFVEVESR